MSWVAETKRFCKIALLNFITLEKVNALVILDIFIVVSERIFKGKVLAKQKLKVLLENMVSKGNHKTKKCQLPICHKSLVLAAPGAFPKKLRTQLTNMSPLAFQKVL